MLSEDRFPLARAAVPQAWRGLRVPALSLLSLPGDGVPGAVPSGEGCVRLVFRSGPDCAAGTSRQTFAASREQDRFPGRNTHGRSERVAAAVRKLLEERGFRTIYTTTASCTISSHCGPGTLGILFMTETPSA